MKHFSTKFCLVALMASGIGCEGSDVPVGVPELDEFPNNLEVLQGDSSLSTFLSLAVAANGFVTTDPVSGEITGGNLGSTGAAILVPTNAAFTNADQDDLEFLRAHPRKLDRLLRAHMMSAGLQPQLFRNLPSDDATVADNSVSTDWIGRVRDSEGVVLFTQPYATDLLFSYTTADQTLRVAYDSGEDDIEPNVVVSSTVTKTENGFIYTTNQVLVTELQPINTAFELHELGRDNFINFASSIVSEAQDGEAVTALVPSEEYLSTAVGEDSIAPVALDPFIRETIALAHTFEGKISTATVTQNLLGLDVTFAGNAGALTANGQALGELTDGGNGNIYFINQPYYVPPTSREAAVGAGLTGFINIVESLPSSDREWVLGRNPFSEDFKGVTTVFAPSNEAVTAAGALSQVEALNIVAAHVVEGAVLAEDLVDGAELETIQGTTLTVEVGADDVIYLVTYTSGEGEDADPVEVSRAAVGDVTDVRTLDGVVHLVNDVIVPDPDVDTVPLGD